MREMAEKWYKKLDFPVELDGEFEALVQRVGGVAVPEEPLEFLKEQADPGLTLVYYLSACEKKMQRFAEKKVPQEILYGTLEAVARLAQDCKKGFGFLGLRELEWIHKVVVQDKVFRIGRLNYETVRRPKWLVGEDIPEDAWLINIHIPAGGKLDMDAVQQSLKDARAFFTAFFPDREHGDFICRSWLIAPQLDEFLPESSNIRAFRRLFRIVNTKEDDACIKFLFSKAAERETLADFQAETELQKKVKAHVLAGGKLYLAAGRIDR